MNIKSLASSSKGNAYIISDNVTTILIECGLSIRELKIRSNFAVPSKIQACLCSHVHSDHSKSLKELLKQGVDCYALPDVFESKGVSDHHRAKKIIPGIPFFVGTFTVMPLEMKHDVPCVGFYIHSFETNEYLLFATDTYLIKQAVNYADYIMIEANYDVRLVEDTAQRDRLFKSHLNIDACIDYLSKIDLIHVKKIYLMHLSSRHSDEVDFKVRVQGVTGKPVEVCRE